jgi:hypothetical protein
MGPIFADASGVVGRFRATTGRVMRDVVILHSVHALASLRLCSWFRMRGRAVVLHWIGSDFRQFARMPAWRRVAVRRWFRALGAVHLIDSPELAEDLAGYGVHGEVIRLLPGAVVAEPSPLPDEPAALAYWSDARADFYGRPIVYALARQWPDVPFRIVGDCSRDVDAPANVAFLGRQSDLDPVYRSCSVLVRVLPHDSISTMVLEAMARGRDVIYSQRLAHTRHATDEASAMAAFAAHVQEYCVNADGAAYVAEHFRPAVWREKLLAVYERAMRRAE